MNRLRRTRRLSHPAIHQPLALLVMSLASALYAPGAPDAPWIPDRGDGTYRNPVLFADYSDPDAIRVGDDYYLVASSFLAAPGLPILHSKDLVNWTILGHVFAEQAPTDHFARPRHGEGVWAPAIRHHAGKFWIYYPDPDFGIYLATSEDPAGPWSTPLLVKAGKGLIDPCPFWDDDGRAYLVHGWAKSRAGISNLLTLNALSPDGTRLLDAGETIIDGAKLPGWHTIEGPKLYKRNGYYYVFAPAGGVSTGYQAVFRAKSLHGPYEARIVLAQGHTEINGPHQGAWVDTPTGQDWFLHFQDRGPFGRVVHLQPMAWHNDWPVIGANPDGSGTGEPVLAHRKPDVGASGPIAAPQTSDEFEEAELGRQWQWNANFAAAWSSLSARPGHLRLACIPAPAARNDGSPATNNLYDAPNFLLQKFPAPEFTVTTCLDFGSVSDGEFAGLAVFGCDYAVLGLHRTAAGDRIVLRVNLGANVSGAEERETTTAIIPVGAVDLRVKVDREARCEFSFSLDHRTFVRIGETFQAKGDRWTGAKVGLIATAPSYVAAAGHADFDWFRFNAATAELQPSLD